MALVGTVWSARGPSPMTEGSSRDNGLTSVIAVNPNDANVIYIGTAGGGVWRSPDGGATWVPLFDRQISMGIGEPGALAIDPNDTNVLYIGTSGRVAQQIQAGLFKSTDAGASCVLLGSGYPAGNTGNAIQFAADAINVIIVDPADSQTVYLSSSSGVYVSADGGQNWTAGNNAFGDARSLVLDLSSPPSARILYAGLNGRGVFQSTDGGQNWTAILTGATAVVAAAIGAAPNGFNKVVVDIAPPASPPNPAGVQVLYASLEGTGAAPDPVGLFMSTDQGATWIQRGATGMPTRTQGGYSFHMAVDPASPGDGANDIIYFGCVGQARSGDAGANFTAIAGPHADTHAWTFIRQPAPTPSIVFVGTDGGIFRSTDGGVNWTSLNAGGLQTGLFYNLTIRPDATASISAGALQDNENETTNTGTGLGWVGTNGGDGWDIQYDGGTAGQLYATSGFWSPAPCTRAYRSTDDGINWTDVTPWGTATDAGCYLAPIASDPAAAGVVYISGNQNLWQSQNGGNAWRNIGAFTSTGRADVAPTNSNNVVVAVGGQVFVTVNALAATVGPPTGVTFTDITRNLPGRFVSRAQFDPNDPTVIYAVLGGFNGGLGNTGHIFRTTITAPVWTDISPALDVPFGALALDGTETPTTIYAGCDLGVLRSVDLGLSWSVLDDIHFPRAPVTDLVLNPLARVLRAATYGRGVFEFAVPANVPAITVNLQDGLDFGSICDGPADLTLQVFNVGRADLIITSVQRLMGSAGFSVAPFPGTPLVIAPGEEVDFTIAFTPTAPGTFETATIRIVSNDPGAPILDLAATGAGGTAELEVAIADSGEFGEVCAGSFVDRAITINNAGQCPLWIFSIASSAAEFIPPGVGFYPLLVASGDSIALPIRFQPSGVGVFSAILRIDSNDPAEPTFVNVSGSAPPPRSTVSIADSGNFGNVCLGSFRDEPLTIGNSGRCALTVFGIVSSSIDFIPPGVESYPLVIAPGTSTELELRFQPTNFGPTAGTITIITDDPSGPLVLIVSGYAPSGKLTVSGSTQFGGVELGQRPQQALSICNTGDCDLHVKRVAFRSLCGCDGEIDESHCERGHHHHDDCDQRCSQFKLLNNPFPATLRPGSCLPLWIQYDPRCETPRCCELVIDSDDPNDHERVLQVAGHMRRTLASSLKCWAAEELTELLKEGRR